MRMSPTLEKMFLFQSMLMDCPEKANPSCPSANVNHRAFCNPVRT